MPNAFLRAAAAVSGPRGWNSGRRGSWGGSGGGQSSFSGASLARMYEDWTPWTYSPNMEVYWASHFMRARARQLVRDNPYVAGVIKAISENVVGHEGRKLRAKIKLADGKTLATSTNKEIERAWKEWGYPENCTADGRLSWRDTQALHIETKAMDGEVLARRLPGFDNPFGYALQFIDADLLDETFNIPASATQNEIRMGIEIDRYNRPLYYHIWNHYPTEKTGQPLVREKVPASEIYHDFVSYRAGQVRGITWFAPVLLTLHTLGSYDEAELVASWVAAAQMGFILNKQPAAVEAFDWKPEEAAKRRMEIEPGQLPELLPGQEIAAFNPNRPNTTHDQFVTTELRGAARGLNVSHFTLSGDTRQGNYSSMRISLQPERDHWRVLQVGEAMNFDRRVYRDWLPQALLNNQLPKLDTRLAADYREVLFEGRGWKWIAPKEDVEVARAMIRLGLTSRQRLCAEQGLDFEEIVEELQHEREVADQLGVDISGVDVIRTNAPTQDEGGGSGAVDSPDDPNNGNNGAPSNGTGNGKNGHAKGPLRFVELLFNSAIGTDRP